MTWKYLVLVLALAFSLEACTTQPRPTEPVPVVRTGPVTEKIKVIKTDTTALTKQLQDLKGALGAKTSTIQEKDTLIAEAQAGVTKAEAASAELQVKVVSLEESNTQLNGDVQVLTNVATNNKKAADEEKVKNQSLELKLARTQRSLYQRDLILGVVGIGLIGFAVFKLRSLIPL